MSKREDFNSEKEYLEFRRKANERNRKYFSKPDKRQMKKEYSQRYRIEEKVKISKYGYKLRARPEYKKRIKKWREENKEHLILSGKEWRVKNKEYKSKKDKEYQNKNREKVNTNQRKWRKENKEVANGYNRKYYKTPKGRINSRHHVQRRLALIKERPCDLSNEKIVEIFNRDKVCVYCGSCIKLELDHIIPLKNGGNSLFNNFVLACKKCNTSKSGRDVFYWCKLMNREVPKIVLELLEQQKIC